MPSTGFTTQEAVRGLQQIAQLGVALSDLGKEPSSEVDQLVGRLKASGRTVELIGIVESVDKRATVLKVHGSPTFHVTVTEALQGINGY